MGTESGVNRPERARAIWAITWCIAAMILYQFGRNSIDGWAEHLLTIGLASVVVALAVWGGAGAADLGVRGRDVGSGAVWGLGVGGVAGVLILIASRLPPADGFFSDDRFSDLSTSDLVVEVLVRVPFSTALFEELLFRGVLLGLLLMVTSRGTAIALSSLLFGLWHVLTGGDFADSNSGLASTSASTVILANVLVTAVAGVPLGWLRMRSKSLLAPTLVHASVNSVALVVAARLS
ncbi:MAG: CPBP family intramembrane glutamic endopeptidase [Acidimicrobiales bacterium]